MSKAMRDRILFVGLSCLDMVYVCTHFPEEDSDQRAIYSEWRRGGNASNNASVFTQLLKWKSCVDCKVEYFGTISEDLAAQFLINDCHVNGIIIENIVRHKESQTPCSSVMINAENGSRTIIHYNKNLPELKSESFENLCLDNYKAIHFEGMRNVEEIRKMVAFIREKDRNREIKVSIELEKPVEALSALLDEDIDIFFVEKEFARIMNYSDSEQTIKAVSQRVHSKALIICPWAESGAQAIDNQNKQIYCSPIFPPKSGVVDTLGAGDTFLGATLFALLLLHYELKDAIVLGCQVAGAKCGQYGYQHLNRFQEYI